MSSSTSGTAAALTAYGLWGIFPVYFKQITDVSPPDVIAWRVFLCFVFLLVIFFCWQGPSRFLKLVRAVDQWQLLITSTLLLSVNWLVFVYAMANDEILQSSLGYFLVPIISVGLGVLVFNEKPNRLKILAVAVAATGMLITFVVAGVLPWISLILGITFGLYGMLRKKADYDSAIGLFMETAVLLPFALLYILFWAEPLSSFDTQTRFWLYLCGVITAVPLLTMIFAARKIELSSLGFFQYITPCMHFLLAVLIYNETVDLARIIAFSTTILAVGLWLLGSLDKFASVQSNANT